jgi:septal ring factor EnvC (AmiA/AmiB activator)
MASRANSDPFGKVKKMIKDLVVRLMEEANEEAEHKGWCDKELTSNQQTREEKTTEVETLRAEIDEHEASIAKLTEDIGNLSEEVSQITAAMAEATKLREEEKADNRQTMADAKAAGQATAQAITVLKEFYEQAGEATAFLQIRQEPYQGMGAESGGVVGMLEVIESDFARLDADTEAGESSAQKAYDEFMSKSTQNKAVKQQTIEHSEGKKQDQEQELATQKSDLEGSEKELDAAMAYFDKLKPSCMDSGESYEDRVARRKEEVESLQEALKILNGEEIA